jgi:CHASE2 domain-containing sensor protein
MIDMKKPIILGLLGAFITILLSSGFSELFQAWEWKVLDIRFQMRGPIATDPNIVMIDADDESVKDFGQWPWQRSIHAQMIDFLNEEKPNAVAYDIWPSPQKLIHVLC